MSIEVIIERTKSIESALAELGASGKGLHEKVSSIEGRLSPDLVKKVRFIASIRNKMMHEAGYSASADTMEGFLRACGEVDRQLSRMLEKTVSRASSSSPSSSPGKGLIDTFKDASPLGKAGIALAALAAAVFFANK